MKTIQDKIITLVRHGYTGDSWKGRYIGSTDVPLSVQGKKEAHKVARKFRKIKALGLVSPLVRARQTAEIIQTVSGIPFAVEEDLRETDFGEWEKLNFEEIHKLAPRLVKQWAKFDSDFSFPGGESVSGYEKRMKRVAQILLKSNAENVLVVTHGGVVRGLVCELLRIPLKHSLQFQIKNCSVTQIQISQGYASLLCLNQG